MISFRNYLQHLTYILLCLSACNVNVLYAESATQVVTAAVKQAAGYSNIDNSTLQVLLDKGVLLVDIRREEEWQQTGIVKGSQTITLFDKMGRVNQNFVPKLVAISNPEQPIMLICRTGNRTMSASEALVKQLGYKDVMNVTHGITGWIAEKRSVEKYQ